MVLVPVKVIATVAQEVVEAVEALVACPRRIDIRELCKP